MSDLEVSIWFAKVKANGPLAVVGTLLAIFALAVLVLFCGAGSFLVGLPSVSPHAAPKHKLTDQSGAQPLSFCVLCKNSEDGRPANPQGLHDVVDRLALCTEPKHLAGLPPGCRLPSSILSLRLRLRYPLALPLKH